MASMKNLLQCMLQKGDVIQNVSSEQDTSFVQDSVHIATKLRNRMLKPSSLLPMGSVQVSVSHLKILISTVPKDFHKLVLSDICPDDRQNYSSFEKMTEQHVIECLSKYVPDSEGTVLYLQISRAVTSAYIDADLKPLERVQRIWHGLYFLRAWKKWLQYSKEYNLKDNFISSNAFTCVEINAYGLIHLIKKFRDTSQLELFIPTIFNSQTCEQTFRQMRCMTTINWTRINFSLQELLHIVGRVELLNDIVYDKLADQSVCFPRVEKKSTKGTIYELPSDEELRDVLIKARETALLDASKLGMHIREEDIIECSLQKTTIKENGAIVCNDLDHEYLDEEQILEQTLNDNMLSCTSLKDYSDLAKNVEENSKFLQVFNEDGTSKTVLKSSLLFLLTESKDKLSKERLQRVRGADGSSITPNSRKRKLSSQYCSPLYSPSKKKHLQEFYTSNELQIGQWCFFNHEPPETLAETNNTIVEKSNIGRIVVGAVLGFKYRSGKNEKEKQYSLDFAPVHFTSDCGNTEARGINVLAKWYRIDSELFLWPIKIGNFYIDINNYIGTLSNSPELHESSNECIYKISENTAKIREMLLNSRK